MKNKKSKLKINDFKITCGERDENGVCDTYVNGEKTNVRLLVFKPEELLKILKYTE
jgi:hypothetical protein